MNKINWKLTVVWSLLATALSAAVFVFFIMRRFVNLEDKATPESAIVQEEDHGTDQTDDAVGKKLGTEFAKDNNDGSGVPIEAADSMMDHRVLSFLLHSYQIQKALISEEIKKRESLEKDLRQIKENLESEMTQNAEREKTWMTINQTLGELSSKFDQESLLKIKNNKNLMKFYSDIPPQKAAEVLKNLDDRFVVALFSGLKPDVITKIMAQMPPERVARLTKDISDRSSQGT